MAEDLDAPLRVVIVDDTADLRQLLRLALERGGFEVVAEAGDGRAGIETVREHRPDLVIIDLAMPVMDGIEALPTLRKLVPEAKIVVLSGFGAQQMSARAVAAGADGYVQKGAPLTTIIGYVDDVVSGRLKPVAPRTLSVVTSRASGTPKITPPVAAVAPAGPEAVPATTLPDTSGVTPPANVSMWDTLRLAPYGVIELADEPLFRLVYANAVAARMIGTGRSGTPLATVAPDLASLVSYHRLDGDATFETDVEGAGRVKASLRRTGYSILVFLDSASEDVGLLRRAIATTAHEVRGPVAVLCGIAETLAWDGNLLPPDQNQRLMDSVARQARILDRITADLLTTAQIQRGTLRIDLQVVDPRAVVGGVMADRFDVEVEVTDDRPVRADPLRFEQMLTNLISNAQKYGRAPYVLRVRPDGDRVAIDVVDHGPGVPPEFRDQLFREFARADGSVATGTGLGLYVVRTLARAQSGDISYAPLPEGGSVFTISLLADQHG